MLEKNWKYSCELTDENRVSEEPIELDCVLVEENDSLPVTTLACRMNEPHYSIDEISMNLADSPLSGPFTLHIESRRRTDDDPGSRWILMGTEPGLLVRSERGRYARSPGVTFTAGAAELVEKDFIPKPLNK